jgi:hypothetical protein
LLTSDEKHISLIDEHDVLMKLMGIMRHQTIEVGNVLNYKNQ